MIDLKKLTKTNAQERPSMIIEGDILPETVTVLVDGKEELQDRQHLVYKLPVNSYVDGKGILHVGVLDACGIVTTKAGKDLSGVALQLKPVTFDEAITVKDVTGNDVQQEVRLQFEPTWRGLWSSLKVVEEKA